MIIIFLVCFLLKSMLLKYKLYRIFYVNDKYWKICKPMQRSPELRYRVFLLPQKVSSCPFAVNLPSLYSASTAY